MGWVLFAAWTVAILVGLAVGGWVFIKFLEALTREVMKGLWK